MLPGGRAEEAAIVATLKILIRKRKIMVSGGTEGPGLKRAGNSSHGSRTKRADLRRQVITSG